jgi:hypothetical protein
MAFCDVQYCDPRHFVMFNNIARETSHLHLLHKRCV